MHWSLAAISASVRRVRHGYKLVAALFVALLSPWCCVCIRLSVITHYPCCLVEYTYKVFDSFFFRYSGRFSELLCYIALLNVLHVTCH